MGLFSLCLTDLFIDAYKHNHVCVSVVLCKTRKQVKQYVPFGLKFTTSTNHDQPLPGLDTELDSKSEMGPITRQDLDMGTHQTGLEMGPPDCLEIVPSHQTGPRHETSSDR